MEWFKYLLLMFPFLIYGLFAVIIIYLIVKRLEEKGNEDFEHRDN
jgi:hypothetical protein